MKRPLTNANIKLAKPGDTLWDEKVTGLHLRMGSASCGFFLYYKTRSGVERRPKLGDYPALSLDRARAVAKEMKETIAAGRDPVAEWKTDRSAPLMKELTVMYMERHGKAKKSADDDELLIRCNILPKLKNMRIKDVTHNIIDDLHKSRAHKPYNANRTLSLLSKMFNLAEKWGYRELNTNPCKHVARFPEEKRRRYMKATEAVKISEALDFYAPLFPRAVAFIYLLMLTGARKSEIANARWEWITGNRLELPDSKTGARTIFLPPQVMDILAGLPRGRGTITGIQSPRSCWVKVCKKAEISGLRLHDLRHSFASAGLASGLSLSQIGELLGHRSVQTTHRYAHLIDEAGQEAASVTASKIMDMMAGRMVTASPSLD